MNKISIARFLSLVSMMAFSSVFMATVWFSLYSPAFTIPLITGIKPHLKVPVHTLFLIPLFFSIIIMGTMVLVAGSPLGDKIAYLFFSIRKKSTREGEKINPAVERIKILYREKFGKDLNINVHVMDVPTINGLALGQHTAALSTGLLKTANDEQIAAVLAHEAGHLHYSDGFYNICLIAAIAPTLLLNALCKIFFLPNEESSSEGSNNPIIFFIKLFFLLLFSPFIVCSLLSFIPLWVMSSVEFFTEWPIEYRADKFAMDMGFGPALVELFEHTEDEDIRNTTGFLSKYLYSHPPTALRIDKIERVLLAEGQSAYPTAEMKAAA